MEEIVEQEIFANAVRKHGGPLLDPNKNDEADKNRFRIYINIYKTNLKLLKPFPTIIPGIVKNGNYNAFASKENSGKRIIALYAGIRMILLDLFMRIMSYSNILINIGSPKEEIITAPSLRNYYTNANDLFAYGNLEDYESYKMLIPKNPIRKQFAFFLTDLAIDFIFDHEFAHHINGHVDYVLSEYGMGYFAEYFKPDTKIDYITFQTLEMDADAMAINLGIEKCIIISKHNLNNNPTGQFYLNVSDTISFLIFAVYNAMIVFGEGIINHQNEYQYKHPPPRLRELMIRSTIDELLRMNHPELDRTLLRTKSTEMMIEAEKAKFLITGLNLNTENFKPEFYSHHPLASQLTTHWQKIRSGLLKFSFTNLAPY